MKQALTAANVLDELAQNSAAAALHSVEQLLEWRKLTPEYRNILEAEEDTAADRKKGKSTAKKS